MKVCRDCKHCYYSSGGHGPYCGSPQRPPVAHERVRAMVHGGPPQLEWFSADTARTRGDLCGVEARWFERRRTLREWLFGRAADETSE